MAIEKSYQRINICIFFLPDLIRWMDLVLPYSVKTNYLDAPGTDSKILLNSITYSRIVGNKRKITSSISCKVMYIGIKLNE